MHQPRAVGQQGQEVLALAHCGRGRGEARGVPSDAMARQAEGATQHLTLCSWLEAAGSEGMSAT